MMRWMFRGFYSFIIICLLLFIFLVTPYGLQVSLSIVKKSLHGKLNYQQVSGMIFGPLYFQQLVYEDDSIRLSFQNGKVECKLPMLALRTLDLDKLKADGLTIQIKSQENTAPTKSESFPLPIKLQIHQARLTNVNLENAEGKTDVAFAKLTLLDASFTPHHFNGHIQATLTTPIATQAQLVIAGTPSAYTFDLAWTQDKQTLFAKGHGNLQFLALKFTNQNTLQNQIQGTATIRWAPELAWQANLTLHDFKLNQISPSLPPINSAVIQTKGEWKENEMPLFNIQAEIHLPETTLSIHGKHEQDWSLQYTLDLTNLGVLVPQTTGTIHSSGIIAGPTKNPTIQGKIAAENLNLANYTLQNLTGEFEFDPQLTQSTHLRIEGQKLVSSALALNHFAFTLDAKPKAEQIHAKLATTFHNNQALDIEAQLLGQLTKTMWQGSLTAFTISPDHQNQWLLQSASQLKFSSKQFDLQTTCLQATEGRICTAMHVLPNKFWGLNTTGNFNNLNFLHTWLPKPFRFDLPTTLAAEINGIDHALRNVNANLAIKNGKFTLVENGESITNTIQSLILQLKSKNQDLHTNFKAILNQKDQISSHFYFPDFFAHLNITHHFPVDGAFNFHLRSDALAQLIPHFLLEQNGFIQGNFSVHGAFPLPTITGTLALNKGELKFPPVQIPLNQLTLKVNSQNNEILYTGDLQSNQATLAINGSTKRVDNKLSTRLEINGSNFTVIDTSQYKVTTSPHIQLRIFGKSIILTGIIDIPKATLKPITFSSIASLPKDTLIIHTSRKVESISPINWLMNLTVLLGKDVVIDTKVLKTHLNGELKIIHDLDQPSPVANGVITLKQGKVFIKGKTLTLNPESTISYIHEPISNPHLNIRISRTVLLPANPPLEFAPSKTTVGIAIKGTADKPTPEFFSQPARLSQADIVSYLLFNSPMTGSSLANYSTIFDVISGLNFGSSKQDFSVSALKEKLGITELGVENEVTPTFAEKKSGQEGTTEKNPSLSESAFAIGTYLTPKIYVRYNRGLLSHFNLYQVRYLFSNNWSIQTETATNDQGQVATGADIFYTLSRKKFP